MKFLCRKLTRYWGVAPFIFILFCYQILTYRATSSVHPGGLAVISAFIPSIIFFLIISWRTRYRLPGISFVITACVAMWHFQTILAPYINWVFVVQRSGIFAAMFIVFGITLLPGRTPMVSQIAGLVHGTLSKQMALYTRHVTTAWVILFLTMTALPLLIFMFAQHQLMFMLVNGVSMTLVFLLLSSEYFIRCKIIPKNERGGMIEGLRAYFNYSKKSP